MRKAVKWIIGILVAMILAMAAIGVFGFWMPYNEAVSSFGHDRHINMYLQNDGSVQIVWPEGMDADRYLLEIRDHESGEVTYSEYIVGQPTTILKELPHQKSTITVYTVAEYDVFMGSEPWLRLGGDAIEITDTFVLPQITDLTTQIDPEEDRLNVKMQIAEGSIVRLYMDGGTEPVQSYEQGDICLTFGEEGRFPMPAHGKVYSFTFAAYRKGEGYSFYGPSTQPVKLNRADLLGLELHPTIEDNGDNTFTVSWNETKGNYYQVLYRANSKKEWKTVLVVPATGKRAYVTPAMKPYTSGQYRVQAWYDGADAPLSQTDALTVEMKAAIVYSTIWPVQDLPVYIDPERTQVIGTAEKGTAFCVMALEQGSFAVRWENGFGFIDSNYCMINLAECMGDILSYQITNSYESAFKIHEFEIPDITGKQIVGYEKVQLSKTEYLVPLLYPVVEKLEKAALAAQKLGYKLKIYESFRPQKATQFLYDTTIVFSEEQIPLVEGGEITEPMTYAEFMTDKGRYAMNYFLAKGSSRHNQGVALDLTLEKQKQEVQMQTPMHDLTWYSETKKNNAEAKRLAKIMTEAGFTGLVSEWWHFQDNDALNGLKPKALFEGVSAQCWMADQNGWRYRTEKGSYLKNCTKTIDAVRYSFDAQGYATPLEEVG